MALVTQSGRPWPFRSIHLPRFRLKENTSSRLAIAASDKKSQRLAQVIYSWHFIEIVESSPRSFDSFRLRSYIDRNENANDAAASNYGWKRMAHIQKVRSTPVARSTRPRLCYLSPRHFTSSDRRAILVCPYLCCAVSFLYASESPSVALYQNEPARNAKGGCLFFVVHFFPM